MNVLKNILGSRTQASRQQIDETMMRCRSACDGLALLNLGCGRRLNPNWINADLVPLDDSVLRVDVSGKLPFKDNELDVIFHAHMLEHLEPETGKRFMQECVRVLRPGGLIRVSVPDLERIARGYLDNLQNAINGDPGADDLYDWSMLEMLDQLIRTRSGGRMRDSWMIENHPAADYICERSGDEYSAAIEAFESSKQRSGKPASSLGPHDRDPSPRKLAKFRNKGEIHRWMYDRYSLCRLMKQIGMEDPRVVGPTESRIPDWEQYGLEAKPCGTPIKPDSLTVEAVKP